MSNETTNPALTFEDTGGGRGLIIARFSDINGDTCSIQTSSLATDDALWLGQQRCTRCQAPTRMHLNRALAAVLIKALSHFVATGTLPSAGTRLTACARRKVLPPGVEVVPIPHDPSPEPKCQPSTIDPHAWTVVDSYERADGSRTWRAMGPWRATRKEAERDAEHGSMLGALPELSASAVERVRDLERERDAALARVAELEEALRGALTALRQIGVRDSYPDSSTP